MGGSIAVDDPETGEDDTAWITTSDEVERWPGVEDRVNDVEDKSWITTCDEMERRVGGVDDGSIDDADDVDSIVIEPLGDTYELDNESVCDPDGLISTGLELPDIVELEQDAQEQIEDDEELQEDIDDIDGIAI